MQKCTVINKNAITVSALRECVGEGLRTALLFLNWSAPLQFKNRSFSCSSYAFKTLSHTQLRGSSLWIGIFRWMQCDLYQLLQIGSEGTFTCQFCLFSLQTERQGWRGWRKRALQIKQTVEKWKAKSQLSHSFRPEIGAPHTHTKNNLPDISYRWWSDTHAGSDIQSQMCSLHRLGSDWLVALPQTVVHS